MEEWIAVNGYLFRLVEFTCDETVNILMYIDKINSGINSDIPKIFRGMAFFFTEDSSSFLQILGCDSLEIAMFFAGLLSCSFAFYEKVL